MLQHVAGVLTLHEITFIDSEKCFAFASSVASYAAIVSDLLRSTAKRM
jgi:hypothetical protein